MLWTELGGNFYATGIDESNRCMDPWAGLMKRVVYLNRSASLGFYVRLSGVQSTRG